MLQKRLKQMREEEEARIEAEEVSKAAEKFKNVGSELDEWEEKHGKGSTGTSTPREHGSNTVLSQLGYTEDQGRRRVLFEPLADTLHRNEGCLRCPPAKLA